MNKLNISHAALAAASICGIGFSTHLFTKMSPLDSAGTDTPAPTADTALIMLDKDGMTKYLKVTDIIDDGKDATFSIIDHGAYTVPQLLELEDHPVVGEAITLADMMAADNVDEVAQMLGFGQKQSQVA